MSKRSSFIWQIVLYVVLFATCVGCLLLTRLWGGNVYLGVLFFVLSVLLSTLLHEVGHLVMGLSAGFEFVSLSVVFVKVTKVNGKLVWSVFNPVHAASFGSTTMYPKSKENRKEKFLRYAMGGVIFNGVWFLLGLVLCLVFRGGVIWTTVGMTLPFTLYLLLVNLIPIGDDSYDGQLILGLFKDDPAQLAMVNILSVQGLIAEGNSPSQIDKDLYFGLPQLREDDISFGLLHLYRYYYFLDGGDVEKAYKAISRLQEVTEYIPEDYLPSIYSELAYIYCLRKDKENAEKYILLLDYKQQDIDCLRAQVGYALLTGNEEDRADYYKRAGSKLKEQVPGMKKFEKKAMRMLTATFAKEKPADTPQPIEAQEEKEPQGENTIEKSEKGNQGDL